MKKREQGYKNALPAIVDNKFTKCKLLFKTSNYVGLICAGTCPRSLLPFVQWLPYDCSTSSTFHAACLETSRKEMRRVLGRSPFEKKWRVTVTGFPADWMTAILAAHPCISVSIQSAGWCVWQLRSLIAWQLPIPYRKKKRVWSVSVSQAFQPSSLWFRVTWLPGSEPSYSEWR